MGLQRLNRRGLVFKDAFIAMIAISLFIIAAGVIITEQNDVYNSGAVNELSNLDRLDNLSATATDQRRSVSPNNADTEDNAEASTFRGAFSILTSVWGTFDLFLGSDGVLASVTERFNLPDYVRQGIITFILIAIAFSLVAIIFRIARGSA